MGQDLLIASMSQRVNSVRLPKYKLTTEGKLENDETEEFLTGSRKVPFVR